MYGGNPSLQILNCSTCGEPSFLWIDLEDMERAKLGLSVESAFATRDNQTYLTYVERGFLTRENCGLRKIGMRRSATDPATWEIYVSAHNYGTRPRNVTLTLNFGSPNVATRTEIERAPCRGRG